MLKGPKMRRSESTESSASTDRPSPPWTSVFSDAKLDLVFSKSSSAWWLDGKRKVSLWRDACYKKKHKMRNLRKFTKKLLQNLNKLEGLETHLFVETTRFLTHVLCVQSIHLPKGWGKLPPVAIAQSTRQKVLPSWPSADAAMAWMAITAQVFHPSRATCLREKPVTLAPLSWTPRWDAPLGHKDDLFEHLEM